MLPWRVGIDESPNASIMKIAPRLFAALLPMMVWTGIQAQFVSGAQLTPAERLKSKQQREEYWQDKKVNKVATITVESQKFKKGQAKGDLHKASTETYNTQGQSVERNYYSRSNKLQFVLTYQYDTQGNVIAQSSSNGKGKLQTRDEYRYANDLLQSSTAFTGSRDKPREHREFEYDPAGWLLASKTINPKKDKLIMRTQCTYHEDGSKKRVEKYDGKGILISATDYACDQAGKTLSASNVKEITVCERFERGADGTTLRIMETISGDKDFYRTVAKFDEENHLLEQTTYNQSGAIASMYRYSYDEGGYVLSSERCGKGGELDFRSIYERDTNGLATSEIRQNGKEETVAKLRYTYRYF